MNKYPTVGPKLTLEDVAKLKPGTKVVRIYCPGGDRKPLKFIYKVMSFHGLDRMDVMTMSYNTKEYSTIVFLSDCGLLGRTDVGLYLYDEEYAAKVEYNRLVDLLVADLQKTKFKLGE